MTTKSKAPRWHHVVIKAPDSDDQRRNPIGNFTKVYVDGEEWYVTKAVVTIEPNHLNRVALEFFAEIEVDVNADTDLVLKHLRVKSSEVPPEVV